MNPIKKTPEIGRYLDDEEKALVQAFETSEAPLRSGLTPERKREIEAMARATMTNERAKISLRIPKRDLARLKSRALQEGIPYQTLINALIPSVRVGVSGYDCPPTPARHGANGVDRTERR